MDRVLHLFAGIIIGQFIFACTNSIIIAMAAAMLIGFIKELFDMFNPDNRFSLEDLFFTTLGGAIGGGALWLCQLFSTNLI